jgi:transposase
MNEHAYDSPKRTQKDHIEIVTRSERRRRWSNAEKQKILQETLVPGATVLEVARRHGLGTGQIYTWRRQALAGAVGEFVPVMIADESNGADSGAAVPPRMTASSTSVVEIEVAGAVIRAAADIDIGFLGAVLRMVKAA